MSAFDFPASPGVGAVYTPAGGPSYIWNGTAWGIVSNPVAVSLRAARNRIVNGAFQISQENGTAPGTVTGYHVADQWALDAVSSSTITAGAGVASGATMGASPAETSAAAGEYVVFMQRLEGIRLSDFLWGTAQAKQAVIAFDVYLPVAGTYWVGFTNATATYTWLGSYTISAGEVNTWLRKTVVIPAGAVNAGTWPTGAVLCCYLRFAFHCGSTYTGAAGFQAGNFIAGPGQALGLSTASNCFLRNVGLYLDDQNTGVAPRWEMPDEAQELIACQRYYEKSPTGACVWAAGQWVSFAFKETKRTAPALTLSTPTATAGVTPWGISGSHTATVNFDYIANARM